MTSTVMRACVCVHALERLSYSEVLLVPPQIYSKVRLCFTTNMSIAHDLVYVRARVRARASVPDQGFAGPVDISVAKSLIMERGGGDI